jgi:hypothetical protein
MRFYVYQIITDGVVRYVGKGTGRRKADHMKMVRQIARRRAAGEAVRTTHFYNRLTRAWLDGEQIEFAMIAEGLSESEAFEREKIEIAVGDGLWNEAPGGEGFNAEQWNDPRFREMMRAREDSKRTPEYRAKRAAIIRSLWADPEYQEARASGRWSPEQRAAFSAWNKKRWTDPELRKQLSEANRQKALQQWRDPETRKQLLKSRRLSRRAKKAIGELL